MLLSNVLFCILVSLVVVLSGTVSYARGKSPVHPGYWLGLIGTFLVLVASAWIASGQPTESSMVPTLVVGIVDLTVAAVAIKASERQHR